MYQRVGCEVAQSLTKNLLTLHSCLELTQFIYSCVSQALQNNTSISLEFLKRYILVCILISFCELQCRPPKLAEQSLARSCISWVTVEGLSRSDSISSSPTGGSKDAKSSCVFARNILVYVNVF